MNSENDSYVQEKRVDAPEASEELSQEELTRQGALHCNADRREPRALPVLKGIRYMGAINVLCPFCGVIHFHERSGGIYRCPSRFYEKIYYRVLIYTIEELSDLGLVDGWKLRKKTENETAFFIEKAARKLIRGKY